MDPTIRLYKKSAAIFALLYFIWPVDAIPDAIPVAGLLDDAGIVAAAVTYYEAQLDPYKEKAKEWLEK